MELREVFAAELQANDIALCRGCDQSRGHKRGFVIPGQRVVHLDRAVATRSTLHRALHEVGHVVNAEAEKGQRSFEREAGANRYADLTMRALGISIPRKIRASNAAYVQRKKRHGDRIRAARGGR